MVASCPFSRRELLGGITIAAVTNVVAGESHQAAAATGLQTSQMPGFYRFRVGEIEITVVSDGVFTVPVDLSASNMPKHEVTDYLNALYYNPEAQIRHMNFALINTGDELLLVDPGGGPDFRATAGKLLDNMRASGYAPNQVDKIIITHAHPDHIWGLMDFFEARPTFANASYYLHEAEWSFWTAADAASRLPASLESFAVGAARHLNPIAERVTTIAKEQEIASGVFVLPTIGHTVGHSSVVVRSNGQQLLITGDALYHPYISFEHPEWTPLLDMLPEAGVLTRKRIASMAAAERMLVLAFHFPFPGLGRVANRGGRHQWIPANWEWKV